EALAVQRGGAPGPAIAHAQVELAAVAREPDRDPDRLPLGREAERVLDEIEQRTLEVGLAPAPAPDRGEPIDEHRLLGRMRSIDYAPHERLEVEVVHRRL